MQQKEIKVRHAPDVKAQKPKIMVHTGVVIDAITNGDVM
jgi:hypothetical protein